MNLRIGFVLCGSFCTFSRVTEVIRQLVADGADVTPILSFTAASLDTRFGTASHWRQQLTEITGHGPLTTLTEVEPIGPRGMFDVLVVAPCTGTTLSKLAQGQSNTPAALAVKSHLRRERPVVLAVSTNDALGASFVHIAQLKNTKHLYLVPMAQDDPVRKPNSLVADFERIAPTVEAALEHRQLQPLLLAPAVP